MPDLLYQLPRNVLTIFRGRNLIWHALAIVMTALIVRCGGDWSYFLSTRKEVIVRLAFPAIVLGSILPIWGTLVILIVGVAGKNRRTITTGWALGQAAILGYLISCGYKAFTGRIPPPHIRGFRMSATSSLGLIDTSHGFQFGFLQGGVFWGWPSSHTTVAFAMAVCVIALHPRSRKFVFLALPYALYVGLGVSVTIHWLSEFVAGAIFGSLIGTVVGRSYRAKPVCESPAGCRP